MSHSKRRKPAGESGSGLPVKNIAVGAAVGAALFFALMLAASAIALKIDMSESAYPIIGLASAALSGFACGFVAVRPSRKNGVLFGALTGVVVAIIAAVSAFAANSASAGSKLFLLMGVIVLMAAAGGIAAANLRKKAKV